MRIHLPDVNVLIALHDIANPFHQRAQDWFDNEGQQGWATCPLTENGFVRVYAQTSTLPPHERVPTAYAILENMVATYHTTHQFWSDGVSLRDIGLFRVSQIAGHKQITDVYLLGLCQQRSGTFVTLDDKISTDAIVSPSAELFYKI